MRTTTTSSQWPARAGRPRRAEACAVLLACALWLGGAVHAQELAVYPASVQITSANDLQRLIMVQTRADGVTLDVTEEVAVGFGTEGIVAWEGLRLKPLADGETQLTVTHGEHAVTVPVTVANAGNLPPVSFQNDVQAVLMRANCNSGGCHGSASGKNGFHLSLFGYDSPADYLSLTREQDSRRMNIALPDESLMLLKPTGAVDHEGGAVMAKDDPLYQTLHRWIAEGAQTDPPDQRTLTGIEILPKEAVLEGENATQRFVVMAQYSDGSNADVTRLAILASSDDASLQIDEEGRATSGQQGEVYIMARFGTFAVVSQAIIIPGDLHLEWPDAPAHNYIDEFVFAKLKKLRTPPAAICTDSEFVRRVYLDVLGVLPTVEETNAFLAEDAPDKRAKLIDHLLTRPEFSELWAMKWAEVLRVSTGGQQTLDVKAMHRYNDWLRAAITSNTPMDELVRELLTAQGGNFANPASNFYLVETNPDIMAENVAQLFMGVQISCAQCHNHPFERWTMDDYYSFSAFFAQVGRKASSDPREQIIFNRGSGEVRNLRDNQVMQPKFLGGPQPDLEGRDRRELLAEWLTSQENPWFAKNIANRVWEHFLGAGIIDPPDDVRVTNPPSNPQLLDEIGSRLVSYEYDLRQLVRDICNSYTYQMSTRPHDPSITDARNFAFARIRRMTAEQMLDAINTVTRNNTKFPNLPLGSRAVEVANGKSGVYFLDVFGRPSRESVCTCERRNEPTLAQSLHLINGDTIDQAIKSPGGALDEMLKAEQPTEAIVEHLYLAALSRLPSEQEAQTMAQYVEASEDRRAALEDTFWSVLNSKEFIFNH